MSISLYQATVSTVTRALENLIGVLEKGRASCEARKIDPAVMIGSRLAPDMFPLAKQVQIASDVAKGGCSRLAQVEIPKYEDDEKTFDDLIARARKTIDYLGTLKPAQIDGGEERIVRWKAGETERAMPGQAYVTNWLLPNIFFHCTTAYAILRHNGVDIGKRDFLGKM